MSRLYLSGLGGSPRSTDRASSSSVILAQQPSSAASPSSASSFHRQGSSSALDFGTGLRPSSPSVSSTSSMQNSMSGGRNSGTPSTSLELMGALAILSSDIKRRLVDLEEENSRIRTQLEESERKYESEFRLRQNLERVVQDQSLQIQLLERRVREEVQARAELETLQSRANALLSHSSRS
ncbi:mitochondrial SMC_N superfamily member [Andalucia godoyi]|uniref:Mitochondrial SMC_N superfamily member n=1 Tax=Andalucia godoyi TaxID=505711 RepID=A0A8K0F4K6_ANDGO|nr:mitochondrial SMC_N superfamily member [Andalucia godoyi]|eukprot:ANDGO_07526.mRNA.1 mitochondrial SMC_N superfamily member